MPKIAKKINKKIQTLIHIIVVNPKNFRIGLGYLKCFSSPFKFTNIIANAIAVKNQVILITKKPTCSAKN